MPPVADIPKNYADDTDLTESQLDAAFEYVETFLNTTKLDSANIQTGGVAAENLASSCVTETKLASSAVTTAKIGDAAVTTTKILDANVTLEKLATALQGAFCPTGSVLAYGATTAPTGWLLCDGSAVSRTTYATLYAVVGNAHGVGDGTTTFNLPDYRGRFLRGMDGGSGRDPEAASRTAMATGGNTGNAIGSVQTGSVGPHTHTIITQGVGGGFGDGNISSANGSGSASGTTQNNTGLETRPINANVAYIIKT